MATTSPWKYSPSVAAGIAFSTIYGATAIVHICQSIRYRALFCIPIITGALWECAGYGVRAYAPQNLDSISIYAAQSILIVLAPAFIAAFDYMVFGRILRDYLPGEKVLRLPPHFVTRIFVTCDVITFFIQATGGGLTAAATSNTSMANLGSHIITIGLLLQLLTFGFFTAASVRFVYKLRQQETVPAGVPYSEPKRRALMWCLWASCFCIMLRSIYRIVEFGQGYNGYLISHEIFVYIFEAVPMIPPLILFNIWHPARIDKKVEADVEMST